MAKKRRNTLLICVWALLASLLFSACNDAPGKDEIERILSKSDPIIEGVLSSAYGFTADRDYLSEGKVAHFRMAEYTFEIDGTKYEAFVDTAPEEPVVYTNYYEEEFRSLFEGRILDAINETDLLSGCEYVVSEFHFSDDTPGKNSVRFTSSGQKLPAFVTPDNLNEYQNASDESPLSFRIILDYYGPADSKISEEKIRSASEKFDWPGHWYMQLNHYESESNDSVKNLLEEYYYNYENIAGINYEYVYHDLADGIVLCCRSNDEGDFEYHIENNTLYLTANPSFECRLYMSDNLIPTDKKYYEIITDTEGKKKSKIDHSWYDNCCFVHGQYEFPLRKD